NTVYVTSQFVHRTTQGGQSWDIISPDLTTNDKSRQVISGGLTPDNLGVEYCCVIYAFDESPLQQGVFWAGSNDGLVHVSRDGGETWNNVTENIPGLPPLGTVRNIDASKWAAGKAYITVDFHQVGNFDPFVYRTEDYGEHWTRITGGISGSPLSYVRNIREDPVRPGLLYLGTENALYVSFDDGENWQSLQTNLPPAPMYWIVVQEHFNDLVVGTYGRGFWILDDITPLQQLTTEVTASQVHLFDPRPAYRFQPITAPMYMFNDQSAGKNPPYGASLNYWLAEKSDQEVKIRITDGAGETVRTLQGKNAAGINRVWWNRKGEPSTQARLRTRPLYAEWVSLGDKGWRKGAVDPISVLVPPGTYPVILEVGGKEYRSELEVLKDPNTEGTEEDILAQTALLLELREDAHATAEMVNRIEWLRRQLLDLGAVIQGRDGLEDVRTAVRDVEEKLISVEGKLFQLKVSGTGQDGVRWPARISGKLAHLEGSIAVADYPPTDQHYEVHKLLRQKLKSAGEELDQVIKKDLSRFNRLLRKHKLDGIS
ncbi:MAG: sialidase, partial [Acidobacteriota bacterium]